MRFQTYPTPTNGDCLFHSIAKIVGNSHTPATLRLVVANNVLDQTDTMTSGTILTWKELYQMAHENPIDAWELVQEFQHASVLLPFKDPLCNEARNALYYKLLSLSYWGDQHAIRVLEEKLGFQFHVLRSQDKRWMVGIDHSPGWIPKHHALLYFNTQTKHYEPLGSAEHFVFTQNDISHLGIG